MAPPTGSRGTPRRPSWILARLPLLLVLLMLAAGRTAGVRALEGPGEEAPATDAALYDRFLEADRLMAAGDYGRAASMYETAAERIERFPGARKALAWDLYRMPYAEIARARGSLKPGPRVLRHRMLVVYVRGTKFDIALRSGERMAVAATQDDAAIAGHAVAEENFRQYLEVLTGGGVTVEFRRMVLEGNLLNAYARDSVDYEGADRRTIRADVNSLRPWPIETLTEFLPEGDSVLIWWPGGDSGASPTGELEPVPLVPWQLGSSRRIVIQVPSAFRRGNTLLHEFFHGLERLYGIHTLHGFLESRRKEFPGWTGTGQYDYFRWHFERTFAPRGWERMDVSSMFPWRADPETRATGRPPPPGPPGGPPPGPPAGARRALAEGLRAEAERFLAADPAGAGALLDRAAKANPDGVAVRVLQARRALVEGRNEDLAEHSARALELDPGDAGACYLRGIALGREGRWKEAHACLTRGLERDRIDPLMAFQRGFVNYSLGDPAAALDDYRACLRRDPAFRERILRFYEPKASAGDGAAKRIVEGL